MALSTTDVAAIIGYVFSGVFVLTVTAVSAMWLGEWVAAVARLLWRGRRVEQPGLDEEEIDAYVHDEDFWDEMEQLIGRDDLT